LHRKIFKICALHHQIWLRRSNQGAWDRRSL